MINMMRKALLFTFFMTNLVCFTVAQVAQQATLPVSSSEKAFVHSQSNYNLQPYSGHAFMQQQLAQQDLNFANNLQSYLQALPSISQMVTPPAENSPESSSPPVLTIPVVVHVIHDPSDPVGTGTNLSITQIESQIAKLNEAFRQLNSNFSNTPLAFQGVAADAEIEFCLANLSPTGTASNGIDRQPYSTNSIVDFNYIENTIKPATAWNPNLYVNIWTVALPGTTPIGGVQGYSYFPISGFAGVSLLDGIVVDYQYFGVGGNAIGDGVACIREVGHYLGLPDIWGQTSNQGVPLGCSSDDGLSDTPDQAAPTGMMYPTCPSTIPQSCGSNDMYSNYMDYMKDQNCQSMFTAQQAIVMRAVLTGLAGAAGYGDRSPLLVSAASTCTQTCNITLSGSSTPETCGGLSDGTATVTASGGTPPLLYAWGTSPVQTSATATGLSAGVYQVTVSDFTGCQQIANVTVSDASAVTGTFTVTNETCTGSDGTATITPTGGVAPYTVVWGTSPAPQVGNTAVGLVEGAYAVSVTDAVGCGYSDFVIVYDDCNQECDSLVNVDPLASTPTIYINPYNGGYISGTNGFNDLAKAEHFTYQGTNTQILGAYFGFALSTFSSPSSTLEVVVWDGAGGVPGAELGSETVSMASIAANAAAFQLTFVPLSIPATSEFFVGFKIPDPSNGDTIAVITSTIGDVPDGFGQAWEQWADGSWHSYQTSWGVDVVHGISVVLGTPPQAAFSPSNITACDSQTVSFTNQTINGQLYQWDLPGSSTPISNLASPTVSYSMPGSYDATLVAFNGCRLDTVYVPGAVTINACPTTCDLYATITGTQVTCNGGNDGSISVMPNAGTAPYSIMWNTGDTTMTVSNLVAGNYTVTITDATGCTVIGNGSVSSPTALLLTTSSTDETCINNDGSVMVMATGGKAPYTYAWNTTPAANTASVTGLAAGTYLVTVTDASNCTAIASATVTDICTGCAMTLNTSFNAPSCNGLADGSIEVTPLAGTYPYTYDWTPVTPNTDSISNGLTAGVYSVTVTDAINCIDSAIIVVTQPDAVTATLSSISVSCAGNDGVASAAVSGGNGVYFYNWNTTPIQTSNQIIGLSPGTYTVGITDGNGCPFVDSIMVMDGCPCGDTVMVSSTAATCAGNDGTATATAMGGGPFTYQWSTSAVDTNATVSGLMFGTYTVTVTDTTGCSTVANVTVDDGCNCGMVLTTTSTGESCITGGDGTASVLVDGIGQAPYSYAWSTTPVQNTQTAIGLSQGTYTVTVTDATGCNQTASVDVEGTISVSMNVVNASCNVANGAATANVSGGDGNYSYLWDINGSANITSSANNLDAGVYYLTVTDGNGCEATTSGVVVQNGSFSVNVTGVDNFCSNSGASATAVAVGGGTPPFTFNWGAPLSGATSANVNSLSTGIYNVTVTDVNGCVATNSVTVTSIDAGPSLSVAQTNVSCFGDSDGAVDLTINANTAVAISWSNGVNSEDLNNLPAGSYTVVVIDGNGCIASTTVDVSQPNPIVVTGTSTPTSSNTGTASALVTGGTPPYNYSWNNGETTQTISNLIPGVYTVQITDANGCTSSGTVEVQQFTSTIDINSLTSFELYPNPTTGLFTIDVLFNTTEQANISIVNTIGQEVWSRQVEASELKLPVDLSHLASGVYFVTINTGKGKAVKRVLIGK